MKTFDFSHGATSLGLAHGPGILDFMDRNPGYVDYIEMPFEQLRHNPGLASVQEVAPVVLHCASMSVAGFIPPSQETTDAISQESARTQTPWIGEHLAFVSADGISEEADRDTAPTNLTYTIAPQLSEEAVERVTINLSSLRPKFSAPIILENSPQYFPIPGSTMGMADFVAMVSSQCDVDLLLDLSHFMITSINTKVDASKEIEKLPLERVVEIHLSGMNLQDGIVWDDHAVPAPPEMFDLLAQVAKRARPRALTMEYNWESLPHPVIVSHLERARNILAQS
jgi:uncharacterized protein (UPF0276 family)